MRRLKSFTSVFLLLLSICSAPLAAREVQWRMEVDPNDASALHKLAVLYANQGKYGEAERLHKRALELREAALGPNHPDVADTLHHLGLVYWKQGRYDE